MSENLIHLARGGYIVDTPEGYVQFGSPPETIKDSMFLPKGVPQIFVLPDIFLNWVKGISVAEMEFPIYYNFFLRKKATTIVCTEDQRHRFTTLLREAVFGPDPLNIEQDYFIPPNTHVNIPKLKNEMKFFSNWFTFDNLVKFEVFENNEKTLGRITVQKGDDFGFRVLFGGNKIADVPKKIEYTPMYDIGKRLNEPFRPPLFGVTCLGPSHGFDPGENTSGFILWINHMGIMIDPPVNSTEWLLDSNVNPKLIDSIILTHCHADHDAGTLQKILEEGRITIYSTKTVIGSFLKKYSAFAGVSPEYLKELFNFVPLQIGKPTFIHDGKFEIFYSLHSIPAIGFRMQFQDQTFVYSSDHNNDPSLHKKLLDDGIIDEHRYKDLSQFPWNSNVIYHEAGIPPLHTPISFLNSLPPEIQKRTVIYHIAKKDFPTETNLTLAKFGIENTLYFDVNTPSYEKTYQILGILKHLDFMEAVPISKALEFITIVKEENYKKDEMIFRKDTTGDKFFIIYSGNVSVENEGLEARKIYGNYDYFGEVAIIANTKRTANVLAETDVIAYTIEKDKFLNFISGTDFEKTLLRLIKIRDSETWNVLSKSKSFFCLTSSQKTVLESFLKPVQIETGVELARQGELLEKIYIIRQGNVSVIQDGEVRATLGRGDFVGQMYVLKSSIPSNYTFVAENSLSLYAVNKIDAISFVTQNPGLAMKLRYDFNF